MKKLAIACVALLTLCVVAQVGLREPGFVSGLNRASSSTSCGSTPYYQFTNTAGIATVSVNDSTNRYYAGMIVTNTAAVQICKAAFAMKKTAGDISSKTYVAQIWNISGTTLTTQQGADSQGVSGNNTWNCTFVDFSFSTAIALNASTKYAVCVTCKEIDASNIGGIGLVATNGYAVYRWKTNLAVGAADNNYHALLKLFKME